MIGENLHVAADGLVQNARTTSGCRFGYGLRPGQYAPECHPGAPAPEPVQDVSDVVGSPLGDDLEGFLCQ